MIINIYRYVHTSATYNVKCKLFDRLAQKGLKASLRLGVIIYFLYCKENLFVTILINIHHHAISAPK